MCSVMRMNLEILTKIFVLYSCTNYKDFEKNLMVNREISCLLADDYFNLYNDKFNLINKFLKNENLSNEITECLNIGIKNPLFYREIFLEYLDTNNIKSFTRNDGGYNTKRTYYKLKHKEGYNKLDRTITEREYTMIYPERIK
jgi:hypothetical protein